MRLVVEVLGRGLRFAERGGRAEERLELALITVDDRGRGDNGRSTRIDLSLTPEDLQRVRATGVRWLSQIELPPGRHQVRLAARATRSAASGMVTSTVDVPKFDQTQLSISGVTLTSLPAALMLTRGSAWMEKALGTPPSAARQFVAGDQIRAAVEVYAARSGEGFDVAAVVEARDGAVVKLPSAGCEAVFRIDTATLGAGAFVLRVTATQPGAGPVERRVPFEIVKGR